MTSLKIYHISSMRRKRNTGRKDKTQQTCDKLRFLINPSSLHQRRKKDGPAPKTRLNIFRKINPGPDPCNTIYNNKRQRTSRDKKENISNIQSILVVVYTAPPNSQDAKWKSHDKTTSNDFAHFLSKWTFPRQMIIHTLCCCNCHILRYYIMYAHTYIIDTVY